MNMKKMNIYVWICAVCLSAGLWACGGQERKPALPSSKGLPGELLLIVDASLWETGTRDSLEAVLKGSMPGLSQHEPLFRMMRIYPENYSGQFSTIRNIIEVRKDARVKDVEVGVAYNVKARPQTYVSVKTHDEASLHRFLRADGERLTHVFVESELDWETSLLARKYSRTADSVVRKVFGYTVKVPADIRKVKTAEDFVWASTDRLTRDMNLVCYALPLAGSRLMSADSWVELRDSVMRRNIPGSTPEQWMTTVREYGKPLAETRALRLKDGRKAYELRGLWEMHRGGLGGPFVSLAFPDSVSRRLLVVEGFIYSPDTNKRDLVRRMEAALRTFVPVR